MMHETGSRFATNSEMSHVGNCALKKALAKAEHTSDARVLVGIDVSKNRHEVLIAVPGKARRRRMTVLNTVDDYLRLIDVRRGFEKPVTIGFGATGNYHRALVFAGAQQHHRTLDPRADHVLPVTRFCSRAAIRESLTRGVLTRGGHLANRPHPGSGDRSGCPM